VRRTLAWVVALGLLVGAAGQNADPIEAAVQGLRRDPVFIDPAAERAISTTEAERLREQIRSAGTPVFVAVLPTTAGDAQDVVRQLLQQTDLAGTYAAVVGDSFRVTSTQLVRADELASAAFQAESSHGTAAVLSRFVDDVAATAVSDRLQPDDGGRGTAADEGIGDDDTGASPLVPLALIAAGGAGLLVWSRRGRRRRDTERRAEVRADAEITRAELSVLADDVLRLEPEVVLHPEARDDYEAAVERYRVASAALDHADDPIDLVRVDRVVEEARYAMARAKALIDGREPPRPPEQLRRPGRHDEPPVVVDDRGAPVYAGGQPFYGGGWFGGGGGLFGGLLLGSMLGGWGWGWGGPIVIDHHDGDPGTDVGDGWGGGDWGGDMGGGDWGGDVGGGDW
jgi:hypothetical protein